ncbi:MAG: PEP-CTERM sorting domain-containing protein, partial [Planctomycetota bacterium]|nr:PEP-CTERM sorting domain-containing protein [Planctomycetota bacterium]
GPGGLVGEIRQAGGTVTVSASIERHDPSLDRANLDQIVDGITDTSYNGHLPYSTYDGANPQPPGGDWYQLNLDRKAKVDSVVFYEGDFAIGDSFVDPRTVPLAGGYFQNLMVEVGRDGIFVPVRGLALSEPLDPYAAYQRIEMTFDPAVGDAVRIRGNAGGTRQFTTIVELEAHGSLPTPVAWTPGADTAWENPANWSPPGVPGPQAIAVLGSTSPRIATLGQDQGVLSLDLRTAGWSIQGPGRTLAVGAGGVASAGSGANVMEPRIQLAANAIWTIGPGNTLRLDGGVDGTGHSLTKSGPGAVEMAGATDLGPLDILGGTFLVSNTASVTSVTVGAATLGGTGTITGPVTLTGDSTLTSAAILTIGDTLTVQGLANQIPSGTILTTGDIIIDPGAVFIINGTLGGDTGALVVRGTLMGKGTIGKPLRLEAGGTIDPGAPSTILTVGQVLAAETPQAFSFEIGAPGPDYANPANSANDVLRLTSETLPFANAAGDAPAGLAADTVSDGYFLFNDPPGGEYKAEFFAETDYSEAIADATFQYWRLDPRGERLHNSNFFSPLDGSLVDWSVVPETAVFGGIEASGYITAFTVVPEPATLALLLAGGGLALLRPGRGRCRLRGRASVLP